MIYHDGENSVALDTQELRLGSGARKRSVVIYVVRGWVVLLPLLRSLGLPGFARLAAGGLFHTIGIVFYALDTCVTHGHGIRHLFVIAGSASHYVAIPNYAV